MAGVSIQALAIVSMYLRTSYIYMSLNLPEHSLPQALEVMTEEQTEDAAALPIFYNAEDQQFYEL